MPSVPISWPVLRDGWSKIFVTNEVEVTHESRLSNDDDIEHSRTSQAGSEASLGARGGDRGR